MTEKRDDLELSISEDQKTVIKRPKFPELGYTSHKILFNSKSIDYQAQAYDIVKPDPVKAARMTTAQSHGLYAMRNKTAKSKKRPTTHAVPINLAPDAAQNMTSLLSKRPLSVLKPRQLNAVEIVQQEIEAERETLNFPEDPVAYFSKCEDGTGHMFIYLNYKYEKNNLNFSPYELVKAPHAEIKPEYFTMSHNGVTRFKPDGDTEHVSLDRWAKEASIYLSIRKLQTFAKYFFWKPFKIWRNYVMTNRFDQINQHITNTSLFNNPCFLSTSITLLKTTCHNMMQKYLLPFSPQKKYSIESFNHTIDENQEDLRREYINFITEISQLIIEDDKKIRDPSRVVVRDSDFNEIKRKNPNIEQLKLLEQKINAERNRRNAMVEDEILTLAAYIRRTDYVLLEYLTRACMNAWRNAEDIVSLDSASIFLIDVSFSSEGEVVFTPSLEELITTVSDALDDSLLFVNDLPRIVELDTMKGFLKERYSDVQRIIKEGPNFLQIIKNYTTFSEIKESIISKITKMFNESIRHCQLFKDFYSIFESGETWTPKTYEKKRGGKSIKFKIHAVDKEIEYDPSEQIVIDISSVRSDIDQFKRDEQRMQSFQSCIVHGALFIDSKHLKNLLTPIPIRALERVNTFLDEHLHRRIDYMTEIFRACSKRMKKEPPSLEQYVEFCEFASAVTQMTVYAAQEISMVDSMFGLFESSGFVPTGDIDLGKNPLHDEFRKFKSDQAAAAMIKEVQEEKYVRILRERVNSRQSDLEGLNSRLNSFPISVNKIDTVKYVRKSAEIVKAIQDMKPEIDTLIHCQMVLNVRVNDFADYNMILRDAINMQRVVKLTADWKEQKLLITTTPFAQLDVERFAKEMEQIRNDAEELRINADAQNSLLREVSQAIDGVYPFIPQILALYNGNMQQKHWEKLFHECEQDGNYNPQIRIDDLIDNGILAEKEKIDVITSTSKGESALESEFARVYAYWQEVQLPLLDSQQKSEDSLLLGNVQTLFDKIADSQTTLHSMLSIPFVQSIYPKIIALSETLENYAQILDMWKVFQSNWTILQGFFSLEGTSEILPDESTTFMMVRRRWMSLVRHTLEKSTMVHVATFPSLLEHLTENNQNLESILSSLASYIDHKRETLPRLYFLSNDEVLSLYSTTDFTVFTRHLAKIFMHINWFDSVMQENNENAHQKYSSIQNFTKLRIQAIVGANTEALQLQKKVVCTQNVEGWVSNLISTMKSTVKSSFIDAFKAYTTTPLNDWIMTVGTYIAALTVYAQFTHDIEEVFGNIDNNPRAFQLFETSINARISELVNLITSPLAPAELYKASIILTILHEQAALTRELSEKIPGYSQQMNWQYRLKLRYDEKAQQLLTEYGEFSVEHQNEYWGFFKPVIYTESSNRALCNLCRAVSTKTCPFLYGEPGVGIRHIISHAAAMFGNFLFLAPGFTQKSSCDLRNLFQGAAITGFWIAFADVQNHSLKNLNKLFDMLRLFESSMQTRSSKVTFEGKEISIDKRTQFFMISDFSPFRKDTEFPSYLRSILKPIGVSKPDVHVITEVKLNSYGFKSTKILAQKITMMIDAVSSLFPYIRVSPSSVHHVIKIVDDANTILRFLMHQKGATFINYYESVRTAEEYSIARATYTYFSPYIHESELDALVHILYAHYQIFNDEESFKKHVESPEVFAECIEETAIRKFFQTEEPDPLNDYLVERMICLYNLLKQKCCVFIAGPPYSGKSTVVEMLKKFYATDNPEIASKFPNRQPIASHTLYFASDTWETMFGTKKHNTWSYGHLHAMLFNLSSNSVPGSLNILKFDGPLTPTFVQTAGALIGGRNICVNTLDTYRFADGVRIIIETDSVANLTPASLCRIGIVSMHNLMTTKSMRMPFRFGTEQLFKQATKNFELEPGQLQTIKDLFIELNPQVVDFIYHTPNSIYYSDGINKMKDGDVYLFEHLPIKAMDFFYKHMKQADVDFNNVTYVKSIMVLSMFIVFKNIINPDQVATFDGWIRTTFIIEIPADWVSFNVPDNFWDTYQRPSLLSLRFYKGKLIPLEYSALVEKPIIKPSAQNIKLPSDIVVCTAQFLPPLFQATIHMRSHDHFILFGPKLCGKSSMIQYLFNGNNDFIPIQIPITESSTGKSVREFIKFHTDIIAKDYIMQRETKTYALIFDNVPPENKNILEFIREITTDTHLPMTSSKDVKYLEHETIRSFFVIVTAESLDGFDARFLSRFTPLQLAEPSNQNVKFIISTIAKSIGISNRIVDPAITFYNQLLNTGKLNFHFSHLLEVLSMVEGRAAKNEAQLSTCIRTLLSEFHFLSLHRNNSKEVLRKSFNDEFPLDQHKPMFDGVLGLNEMYYPEINISSEGNYSVSISKHQLKGVQNMLKESSNGMNPPISIQFNSANVYAWTMLQRALSYPTGNVLFVGDTGSGRFQLTRFIAHQKGYQFVSISKQPPSELITHEERIQKIGKLIVHEIAFSVLSGRQLVVFLRDDDMEDISALSSIIKHGDITEILEKSSVNELYYKLNGQRNTLNMSRLETYMNVRNLIRSRVHFVIAVSPKFDVSQFPSYYIIDIGKLSGNLFETVSNDVLKSPAFRPLAESTTPSLPKIIMKIHEMIADRCSFVTSGDFVDFVKVFLKLVRQDHDKLTKRNNILMSAIRFVKDLEKKSSDLALLMADLGPRIDEISKDSVSVSGSFTSRKEMKIQKLSMLDEEERLKTAEFNQISEDLNNHQSTMAEHSNQLQQATDNFRKVTQDDVASMKELMLTHNPVFNQVMSFMLIMMGQLPIMETNARRLFLDDFVNVIINSINPEIPDETVLEKAETYHTEMMTTLTLNSVAAVSEPLASMFSYANQVMIYMNAKKKLLDLQNLADSKSVELQHFIETSRTEKTNIADEIKSIDEEAKEFQSSIEMKEQLEREMDLAETKKRSVDMLYKGLDMMNDEWLDEQKLVAGFKSTLVGDTLLLAAYKVYFGSMRMNDRHEMLQLLLELIRGHQVPINLEPLDVITERLKEVIPDKLRLQKNFLLYNSEVDYAHIISTPRPPLIIDPDDFIFEQIMLYTPKDSIRIVTIHSKNFNETLNNCIKNGLTMIVRDVSFLHPYLAKMLPYINIEGAQMEIGAEDTLKFNPNFRIYMFASGILQASEVPSDLYARTTVIDASDSSLESCREIYLRYLINFSDSELIPRLIALEKGELNNQIEVKKFETETLQIIDSIVEKCAADDEYDFMNDGDVSSNLMRAKECYFAATNVTSDVTAINTEVDMTAETFRPHTRAVTAIWQALSRYMPKRSKSHQFSYKGFIKTLEAALQGSGLTSGILNHQQIISLQNIIVKIILKHYTASMSNDDSLLFLFISAFLIKASEGKANIDDFDIIVEHICEEFNSKYDLRIIDTNRGDPIDQLKFSNIVNVFGFMTRFISDVFGKDFMSLLPVFSVENFLSDHPSMILCDPEYDATPLLENFIASRGGNKKLISVSLSDDIENLEEAANQIRYAAENGWTVIIHYTKPTLVIGSLLSSMIEVLFKPTAKGFRFLLITTTTDYLSRDFMLYLDRIRLDSYPLIKTQMVQLYHHQMEAFDLRTKQMKKIGYAAALLYSLLRFSSIVYPLGLSSMPPLTEGDFGEVLTFAQQLQDTDISIRNVREFTKDIIYGRGIIDGYDRRKLRALTASIMAQDLYEDSFSFVDSSSTEAEQWLIPSDVAHQLERLPVFAGTGGLLMSRVVAAPILNLNLSLWISAPFFPFYTPAPVPLSDTVARLKALCEQLPNPLESSLFAVSSNSPIALFLHAEGSRLNDTIAMMQMDAEELPSDVLQCIARGRTPPKWTETLGFRGAGSTKRFLQNICDRAALLDGWLRTGAVPQSIDARLVTDIRGLLVAYRNEIALQRHSTANFLSYEFIIGPDPSEAPPGLTITGLSIIGANWDASARHIVQPNQKTAPVTALPPLLCALGTAKTKPAHIFSCPLLRELPGQASSNHIWTLPLLTELVEKQVVATGACIVCHIPDTYI